VLGPERCTIVSFGCQWLCAPRVDWGRRAKTFLRSSSLTGRSLASSKGPLGTRTGPRQSLQRSRETSSVGARDYACYTSLHVVLTLGSWRCVKAALISTFPAVIPDTRLHWGQPPIKVVPCYMLQQAVFNEGGSSDFLSIDNSSLETLAR
jgi:hypothetical protein